MLFLLTTTLVLGNPLYDTDQTPISVKLPTDQITKITDNLPQGNQIFPSVKVPGKGTDIPGGYDAKLPGVVPGGYDAKLPPVVSPVVPGAGGGYDAKLPPGLPTGNHDTTPQPPVSGGYQATPPPSTPPATAPPATPPSTAPPASPPSTPPPASPPSAQPPTSPPSGGYQALPPPSGYDTATTTTTANSLPSSVPISSAKSLTAGFLSLIIMIFL